MSENNENVENIQNRVKASSGVTTRSTRFVLQDRAPLRQIETENTITTTTTTINKADNKRRRSLRLRNEGEATDSNNVAAGLERALPNNPRNDSKLAAFKAQLKKKREEVVQLERILGDLAGCDGGVKRLEEEIARLQAAAGREEDDENEGTNNDDEADDDEENNAAENTAAAAENIAEERGGLEGNTAAAAVTDDDDDDENEVAHDDDEEDSYSPIPLSEFGEDDTVEFFMQDPLALHIFLDAFLPNEQDEDDDEEE